MNCQCMNGHKRENTQLDWCRCTTSRGMRGALGLVETVSVTSFVAMRLVKVCGYTESVGCTVLQLSKGRTICTKLIPPTVLEVQMHFRINLRTGRDLT